MATYSKFFWRSILPVMALAVQPVSGHAETLEEAVRTALSSHPGIEMAAADADAARQERRVQRSGYFPDVSLSGTAGRMFGNNATSRGLSVSRGEGYSDLWNTSVSARETIFDGFETSSRVKSAASQEIAADLVLVDTEENIAYKMAQAYFDLMRAKEGLAMLNDYSKKADEYLSRIKKMVDEGASDEAEHQQARDIRVVLDGLIADYEGQVRSAESNYFNLAGRLPESSLVKPHTVENIIPADLDGAIGYSKDHHPSVLAARRAAESAAYDVRAEKAPLFPSVDGELSYLVEEKRDVIGGELEDGRAVVNMNWQFETGGAQLAKIKKKKHQEAEAKAKAEDTEHQVELGVRLAYSEYQTARRQVENQKKRRELNEKLFATYKTQFEGGKITPLQLMQGENQLFTTGLEQTNGQYRLLASEYAILASMGRLRESLGLAGNISPAVAAQDPDQKQPPASPGGNPLTNAESDAP